MRSVYPAQRTKPAPSGWGVLPTLLLLGAAVTVLAITMLWGPERSTAPPEAVFPLPERYTGNYTDDWGAERVQGRHEGTDIFAPAGTPIYSITGGTVVRARGSEDSGWNTLGGYTVMIEAAYDVGPIEEGDLLYYAHMNGPSGPRYGETVEAGQKIGEVGDTGQGPEGTHGRFEPHLHLGWYDGALFGPERPEAASGAMNPFPPAARDRERGRFALWLTYAANWGGYVERNSWVSLGGGSAENDTGRIEAFSDGVFAIAITLLVIEIGVPHLDEEPEGTTLFEALLQQWPSYLGYAISFLQIGVIWANHHNRFRYIVRSDHILLFLNILFLMCVAFIPFTTALLAEYLRGSGAEQATAGAVYAGTLAVTAVFFTLLWLYAAGNYRLVSRNLDPNLLRTMTRRYVLGAVAYLLTFALAFVSVTASLILIVVLALIFVLPEPGDRSRKERPGRARRGSVR